MSLRRACPRPADPVNVACELGMTVEEAMGLCNKIIVGKLSVKFGNSEEKKEERRGRGSRGEKDEALAVVLRKAFGGKGPRCWKKIDGKLVRRLWALIGRDEEGELQERRDWWEWIRREDPRAFQNMVQRLELPLRVVDAMNV
ncbi:hypothetical protein MMC06_002420 [Schaereria dolodes]|nr:hypothetical protein [Schaereria dolodes]